MFGYALKHPIKKANHLVRNHRELTSLTLSCLLGRFQCFIFLGQVIQCPSECVPYMCSSNLFWLQLNILTCILVYTFPCSPMICQSFISCLCTPDQNWLHFSLSAALLVVKPFLSCNLCIYKYWRDKQKGNPNIEFSHFQGHNVPGDAGDELC